MLIGNSSWWRVLGGFLLALLMASAANAQSTPANTPAELFNYPDTALRGISSAEVSRSLEECRKLCMARSGCAGFDHLLKDKAPICRLFASVSGARDAQGSAAETRSLIGGYKQPTNPPLEDRLAELKRTDTHGEELYKLAMEAFKKGNKAVGLEAINLAMQRGNQTAKLEVAKWYDPRTFASDRVNSIDANKAARAYFELALEGNGDANRLLASLCDEANNGSSTYYNSFEDFLRTTYCEGSIGP